MKETNMFQTNLKKKTTFTFRK